jgi:hypothetical protein
LGWGGKENYKNLGDLRYFGGKQMGVDRQGEGILPRAVEPFSKEQVSLLERAKELKHAEALKKKNCPVVLGSHFTMISYKLNMALNSKDVAFTPRDKACGAPLQAGAFNEANEGTCEHNQHWFYKGMVFGSPNVDWYISGHSHRAGVYQVSMTNYKKNFGVSVNFPSDPGLSGNETTFFGGTRFVVSGSGGLIGRWQNLNGELGSGSNATKEQNLKMKLNGGLLRPPSGSWIDVQTGKVEQVKAVRPNMNEKPRLCVILDYLTVMNPGKKIVPLEFVDVTQIKSQKPFSKIEFTLSEEMVRRKCLDLDNMKIWLFQKGETAKGDSGEWREIRGTINNVSENFLDRMKRTLEFSSETLRTLDLCLVEPLKWQSIKDKTEREEARKSVLDSIGFMPLKHALQAFCEIPLNKPRVVTGRDDLNCEDPWIFPLEIGIIDMSLTRYYYFRRPFGEKGEVPDWWFRAEYFGDNGYIPAIDAIKLARKISDSTTVPPIPVFPYLSTGNK